MSYFDNYTSEGTTTQRTPFDGVEYQQAVSDALSAGVSEQLSCANSSSDPMFAVLSESASLILVNASVTDIRLRQSSFALLSRGAFAAISCSFSALSFEDAFIFSGYDTDPTAYMEIYIENSTVTRYNQGRSLLYTSKSFTNFIAAGPGTTFTLLGCEFSENFMVDNDKLPFAPLIYVEDFYNIAVQDCTVIRNYLRSGGFLYALANLATDTQVAVVGSSFSSNMMDSVDSSFLLRVQALVPCTYQATLQNCAFDMNHGNYLATMFIAVFPSLDSAQSVSGTVVLNNVTFTSNALGGMEEANSDVVYTEEVLSNYVVDSTFMNTTNYSGQWSQDHSLVYDFAAAGLYLLSDFQQNSSVTSLGSKPCASEVFLFEPQNFLIQRSTFANSLDCPTAVKISNAKLGDQQVLDTVDFFNEQLCVFIIHGLRFTHIILSQLTATSVDRFLWVFYAADQFRLGIQVEIQSSTVSDIASMSATDGVVILQQGSFSIYNTTFSRISTQTSLMFVASASLEVYDTSISDVETNSTEYSSVFQYIALTPVNFTLENVSIDNARGPAVGPIYLQANLAFGRISGTNITNCSSGTGNLITLEIKGLGLLIEDSLFENDGLQGNTKGYLIFIDFKLENTVIEINRSVFLGFQGQAVLMMQSQQNSASVTTSACQFVNNNANIVINRGTFYADTGSLMQNNTGTSSACYDGTSGSIAVFTDTQVYNNRDTFQGGLFTVAGPEDSINMTGVIVKDTFAVSLGGVLYFKDDAASYIESSEFYNNTSLIASVLLSNNYKLNTVTFKNCTFEGNQGKTLITIYEGSLLLQDCRFTDNSLGLVRSSLVAIMKSSFSSQGGMIERVRSSGLGCYLLADSSSVSISDAQFNGLRCNSAIDMLSSSIEIQRVQFANGTQALTALCNLESPCSFKISACQLTDLHSWDDSPTRAISIAQAEGSLENVQFSNMTIAGVYLKKTTGSLTNCSFTGIDSPDEQGSAILLTNCKNLTIESSSFQFCTASTGTLFATSSSLDVINSTFTDCQAMQGGAISLQQATTSIEGVTFMNNSASSTLKGQGGAIYSVSDSTLVVKHSSFTKNIAILEGGAVYWTDNQPTFEDVTFNNNSAQYGPDLATNILGSLTLGYVDSTLTKPAPKSRKEEASLYNIPSGQTFPGTLVVNLVDVYGQLVITDNSTTAMLIPQPPIDMQGQAYTVAQQGELYFKNFSLIASPGTTQSLLVKTVSGRFGGTDLSLQVYMRDCLAGESQQGVVCVVCEPGSYTLEANSSLCKECPDHAACLGGSAIFPDKEYWREDIYTDNFYKCFNPQACDGNANYTNPTGECDTGYKDKLCSQCKDGYSRGPGYSCRKCPDSKAASASLMVLVIVCAIVAAAFLVRSSVKTAILMSNYRSVFIKILFNYFQVIGLIITSQLEWPETVSKAFFAHDYSTTFPEHIFSFQCLFDHSIGDSFFYMKLLAIALLPYMIIVLAYVFWKVASNLRQKAFMVNEFIASILILLFMVHPTFTKITLSAFDCYEIEGEYWLREDLTVKCWTQKHIAFAVGIGMVSILIWSLLLPLYVVYRIFRNRNFLDSITMRTRFGFMYIGYKQKYCYWEYLVILRKVFIIIPSVFLASVSLLLQAIVIHAVLLLSLFLHELANPYEDKYLNDLEFRAIVVGLLSIYCGMSFLAGGLTDVGRVLMMLVFIAVNLYFLLYWLSAFTQVLSLKLVKSFPIAIQKGLCCFPRIQREAKRVLATDSRRCNIVSFNGLCEGRQSDTNEQLKDFPVKNLHEFYLIKLGAEPEVDESIEERSEEYSEEEEEVDDFEPKQTKIH